MRRCRLQVPPPHRWHAHTERGTHCALQSKEVDSWRTTRLLESPSHIQPFFIVGAGELEGSGRGRRVGGRHVSGFGDGEKRVGITLERGG